MGKKIFKFDYMHYKSLNEMSADDIILADKAIEACSKAHAPQMDYGYQRAVQLYKGIVKPEEFINEEEMAKAVLNRPGRVHLEECGMLYGLYWFQKMNGNDKAAYDAIARLMEIGVPGAFGYTKGIPIAKKLGIIK